MYVSLLDDVIQLIDLVVMTRRGQSERQSDSITPSEEVKGVRWDRLGEVLDGWRLHEEGREARVREKRALSVIWSGVLGNFEVDFAVKCWTVLVHRI